MLYDQRGHGRSGVPTERSCTIDQLGRDLDVIIRSVAPDGSVVVHGDYGPQNLLFNPISHEVVAVLDWEFSHSGAAVEDLAWAEWIDAPRDRLVIVEEPFLIVDGVLQSQDGVTSIRAEQVHGMKGVDINFDAHDFY